MTSIMDESWITWVKENLGLRVPRKEIFNTLANRGFNFTDIVAVMNLSPEEVPFDLEALIRSSTCQHENRSIFNAEKINTQGNNLDIYRIKKFLSKNQCKKLTSIIRANMKQSTVTSSDTDKDYIDPGTRTSSTCDLDKSQGRIVGTVDDQISQTLGIHTLFSECIQGQHYKKGEQFKEHTDTFTPNTPEYEKNCTGKGQRTWTVMVYLNEPQEGGETSFPLAKTEDGNPLMIKPELGLAVAWNNLYVNGEVNEYSLHEGVSVKKGVKTIITKWFREKRDL